MSDEKIKELISEIKRHIHHTPNLDWFLRADQQDTLEWAIKETCRRLAQAATSHEEKP